MLVSAKASGLFFTAAMRARKMAQEMKSTKGIIGLRGRLGFLNREVAIVGVFENEDVLNEFAHNGQHAKCIVKVSLCLK